jgi:hypothetical protein
MRIPTIASATLRYPHSPSINHYLFFPLLNLPHAKTKTGCDLRRKLRHMCTKVHLSAKANGCNSKNGFAIYCSASPFQIHCKRKMLRHIKKTVHFIHALKLYFFYCHRFFHLFSLSILLFYYDITICIE